MNRKESDLLRKHGFERYPAIPNAWQKNLDYVSKVTGELVKLKGIFSETTAIAKAEELEAQCNLTEANNER